MFTINQLRSIVKEKGVSSLIKVQGLDLNTQVSSNFAMTKYQCYGNAGFSDSPQNTVITLLALRN